MGAICALLLAAGKSSRMGELKALLPWQGRTLLEHQLEVLKQVEITQVVVVLGYQSDRLENLVRNSGMAHVVFNPNHLKGKTTSIKAGLNRLIPSVNDILVTAVDQPRSVMTLRTIIRKHQMEQVGITIPTYKGKGGHPVVFSNKLLPELLDISEKTLGLKAVVRKHSKDVLRMEMESSEVLLDLNNREDYDHGISELWNQEIMYKGGSCKR